MIDTNIKGILYSTRLLLPLLEQSKGHIVNIGSTAGRWSYPGGGVYCASKFAVRALTEVFRWDLDGLGIRVTNISTQVKLRPNLALYDSKETLKRQKMCYKNTEPLTSEDIAEATVFCVNRPKHVNITGVSNYANRSARSSSTSY